jgi:hypothetical protein
MSKNQHTREAVAIAVLVLFAFRPAALAHRDDYLNETLVYRTVDRGVTELENWFDLDQPRSESAFFQHTLDIEHGVSDHFTLSALVGFDSARRGYNYGRSQLEARYRFGEENPNGISIAATVEFENDQLERSDHVSPRIILNRDFKDFNIALNLFPQFELRGHEGHAFGYAIGLRYGQEQLVRCGLEIQETVGERCLGQVIPQLWIRLPYGLDLKIGYGQRLTSGADNFFRIIVETEFGERGEPSVTPRKPQVRREQISSR